MFLITRVGRFAAGITLLIPAIAAAAQSCSTTVDSGGLPTPSVAPGYNVNLVASGFDNPRGIIFDSAGHLLVVDSGKGVYHVSLDDAGDGCVTELSKTAIVEDSELNHGIELSMDGKTLYASSAEAVYSYPYNPKTATATVSERKTIVNNMTNSDHTTRTLLLSKMVPGMLMVTRGSTSNVDRLAAKISSGHSQIKVFNIMNQTKVYDFTNDGMMLGWGLRNDVGIAEEPSMGGIYSVENSVDQMTRMGDDIHEDNPAEELNYFGTLAGNTSPNQGGNFGYPECYSAWEVNDIPMRSGLQVGMQFAIGSGDLAAEDAMCQNERIAPRSVFQAHMAPLDIKFNTEGSEAWVTFHGSWDRTDPVGYKVSMIRFANGEPVEDSTSMKAAIDIVSNPDNSMCPNNCFRPVGLAFDPLGRLFFSSDATGQLYIITKASSRDGAVDTAASSSKGKLPSGGSSAGGTGAASQTNGSIATVLIVVFAVVFALM